jgi:hypothetical protein
MTAPRWGGPFKERPMIANQASEPRPSIVGHEPETSNWQARFIQLLPRIRRQVERRFRHLSPEARDDATAEVIARTFESYARLVARGKEDRAFATALVRYAVAQFRMGRRVGSRMNGHDVTSVYCQHSRQITVEQLDQLEQPTDDWREIAVEDKHSGPAEVAATRVDFAAWLESLPERTKRVAETLAIGEATSHVARMFGCSASRISQLRRELFNAWQGFQGDATLATSATPA